MNQVFSELKVIELAGVLAGPLAGMFFAELGAKVIKVESALTDGDVTRSWKLPSENPDNNVSAYFASTNYKKEYIFLDFRNQDHINEVYRLVKDADIVISNFKEGDDLKFGLDYSRLKTINPKLIYAHLSGFESEPSRVAYDVVLQAEAGFMFMNGTPESGPVKMPLAMMDILAAQQLKQAILTALWLREKNGRGHHIECSLEASALAALTNQATNYLMAGSIPQAMGSLHPNIAPYGESFKCADGKLVVLAIGTDRQFKKLCKILGDEPMADYEHFTTNSVRVEHRKALYVGLQPLFKKFERQTLLDLCIADNVPVAAIRSMDEVFENKKAKEMILEELIEGVNTKRVSTVAFRIIE